MKRMLEDLAEDEGEEEEEEEVTIETDVGFGDDAMAAVEYG